MFTDPTKLNGQVHGSPTSIRIRREADRSGKSQHRPLQEDETSHHQQRSQSYIHGRCFLVSQSLASVVIHGEDTKRMTSELQRETVMKGGDSREPEPKPRRTFLAQASSRKSRASHVCFPSTTTAHSSREKCNVLYVLVRLIELPEARTPVARFPPSVLDLIRPRRLSCRSLWSARVTMFEH